MGYGKVFDNLTFKRMDALRERISLSFELLFLDACNLKQILTLILRINYFRSPFRFSLISIRGIMTWYKLLLPPSYTFFCITSNLGLSGFSCDIFLSLKARNSMNFQPICKILVSKIISNLRYGVIFP